VDARSAARTREALALACALEQPFSVSYACHLAAALYHWRREIQTVQELEDEALALDTEHGFALLLTTGTIQRGWLLAQRGQAEEGLVQMQAGLARHRDIGAMVLVPAFLGLIAGVQQQLGRPGEGLATVNEALQVVRQSGQHYWEAELHRMAGVLALELGGDGESHLLRAVEVAHRQRAHWLELRAAASLSRLWADRGKLDAAHALLSDVYAWFTEGLDAADLSEARAWLDELDRRRAASGEHAPPAPHADAAHGRPQR
jgi:predicted ATPase